ncbi:MAG: TIR domain-containing protein [Bacteroidales bacterium]|nr:TIR domain-containing protein [Bacteroidales bacterium]
MQGKNFDIFISYRRSDGDKVARILDLAFKNDGYRCFLDYNSIEGGLFEQKIHVAIKDAPVFVMVMTPDYFSRCNQEGDWVRKEIELALKYEKTIIPISIDNIVDKVPTDLDEDFRARVGAHNFAIVYTNSTFDVTFKKMLDERIRRVKGVIQNARNKAKVKVMADVDCDLKRGDELIATLQAGKENLIYVSGGKYKVKAVSCDFRDIQQDIQIDISNVSFEYDLDVNLAGKVEERRREEEAKTNEKLKREKEIEAQKKLEELLKEQQKKEAEERRREAERRERERRQREEKARRRREERERRKEELKEWWERNKSKCVMLLAVIAGAVAGTWCIKNCKGATETATETAVETITEEQNVIPVVETPAMEIQEETWINEEEVQRQAEIERQKAKERKINLKNSFKVLKSAVKDKNVLIIDDVLTTGYTADVLAEGFKKAGANSVYVLTIASVSFLNDKI